MQCVCLHPYHWRLNAPKCLKIECAILGMQTNPPCLASNNPRIEDVETWKFWGTHNLSHILEQLVYLLRDPYLEVQLRLQMPLTPQKLACNP